MERWLRRVGACAVLLLTGCKTPPARPGAASPGAPDAGRAPAPERRVTLGDVGLDAAAIDRSADPCQDFHQYACGGWLAKNEIPAERSRYGRLFVEITQRNLAEMQAIVEGAAAAPGDDPALKALGSFYAACMDETAIEAAGTAGIDPLLKAARAVRDPASLAAALAEMHRHGVFALFSIGDEQDAKDATRVIARLDQGGLGLFDRDAYLGDDARAKGLRAAYAEHLRRMMGLLGLKPVEAKKAADDVLAIETALARASMSPVERRDPHAVYHKIDREGLTRLAPSWAWDVYFKGLGFADLHDINVAAPSFFQGLDRLTTSTGPAAWRSYLVWHALRANAEALPARFASEAASMRAALIGQKQRRNRRELCLFTTDGAMPDYVGRPFVGRRFPPGSREGAEQIMRAVGRAFEDRLGELEWMDDATRARARAKHGQMARLVGHPTAWRTYDFVVDRKTHAANVLAAQAFDMRRKLAKIGRPVDREAWQVGATDDDAHYDPQLNQLIFAAGILQPPYYSPRSSVAVNFGAIGSLIGHELSHGFDDEGSQYDAKGDLASWWQPETRQHFEAKAQCVVDQYSAYEPLPGVKLNGKLTLGENIADNAGLKLAFRAYRKQREGARERLNAEGLDEDQQFFLAFGQLWCLKEREERVRMMVQLDPHSPARFRTNGALSNLPEFARAFSCAEGKPLSPKSRCEIW